MTSELNPYVTPVESVSQFSRRSWFAVRIIALVLLMSVPSCVALQSLKNTLLESRVLNTKDLAPFVGGETGTIGEYILNIWHWDAATLVFAILCIPCTIIRIYLLNRKKPDAIAG